MADREPRLDNFRADSPEVNGQVSSGAVLALTVMEQWPRYNGKGNGAGTPRKREHFLSNCIERSHGGLLVASTLQIEQECKCRRARLMSQYKHMVA